jgi:hypothetical protein
MSLQHAMLFIFLYLPMPWLAMQNTDFAHHEKVDDKSLGQGHYCCNDSREKLKSLKAQVDIQ